MKRVFAAVIHLYRIAVSPFMAPRCRFLPTCSEYALEALERHGAFSGTWLAVRRIARCHPFHPGGIDEVPIRLTPICRCRWPATLRGERTTER